MQTKSQKRARKRRISLAGGESAALRQHPLDRTHTNQPEDAQKTALQARVRIFGGMDTPEGRKALSDPLWGCSVGRLIVTEPKDRRADLANALMHTRKTQAAYDRAIGAPNRHAQCLRILAPSEVLHADAASPAWDDRPVDERIRQATSAQMRLETWIGHCDSRAVSAFKQAVINDPDGPVRDWEGVRNCLWCVVEGLKGETVKVRVR